MRYQNVLEQDLRNHLRNNSNDLEDDIVSLVFDAASCPDPDPEEDDDPKDEDDIDSLIFDAASCGNKRNAAIAAQMLAQGNGFITPTREVNTNVYVDALPGRRRP